MCFFGVLLLQPRLIGVFFIMFTGIINDMGKLKKKNGFIFSFEISPSFYKKIEEGTSVSINGVCLTVFKKQKYFFSVEIMPETEKRTMLKNLSTNDLVNLELPARADTLLSGHIVQGHIDGTAKIKEIKKDKNSRLITFSVSKKLAKYLVEKGSIAVNGISLTIAKLKRDDFIIGIIPYTWENTMLNKAKAGDLVNIEIDIIGKYLKKFIQDKNI